MFTTQGFFQSVFCPRNVLPRTSSSTRPHFHVSVVPARHKRPGRKQACLRAVPLRTAGPRSIRPTRRKKRTEWREEDYING